MPTARSPLTQIGYSLVALPKTGIKPLQLLYKTPNGVGALDAAITAMFTITDAAPPQPILNGDTIDIKGNASLTFDAKGGINILDWLMNKLNMGKLSADVTLSDNYTVTVSYTNVKEDKVSLLELDNFISSSEPGKQKFNTFRDKLEDSELYVINAVLKSNTISISIDDKNGQDASADANVKGILDANVSIGRKVNNSVVLDYKTDEDKPLVFAFKAQQIIYKKKNFWNGEPAHFRIKEQIGQVLLSAEDFPTLPLDTGSDLVEL